MEIALGATSLLLQLFAAAIEGYDLFQSAANANQEVKTFVLRLKMEQCRLARWGELIGLSGLMDPPVYTRHVRIHEQLIIETLKEIRTVLDNLRQLANIHDTTSPQKVVSEVDTSNARSSDISGPLEQSSAVREIYGELTKGVDLENMPSTSSRYARGLNHLVRFAKEGRIISKEPKRLSWAMKDQDRFRKGLDRLRHLTNHLHETVSDDQMDQLLWQNHETWLSVLQLSNTADDVKAMLTALRETSRHDTALVSRDNKLESHLHTTIDNVASFAFKMSSLGRTKSMLLGDHNMLGLQQMSEEDDGCRTLAILDDKPVWIEWRSYTTIPVLGALGAPEPGFDPDLQSVQNVERLTWLLSQPNQPDEFRLPNCLGYVDDFDRLRFGVVLHSMSSTSRSLLSWFDEPRIGVGGQCMIARQLAESLLYVHAVNWLHKGLRSAGILFEKSAVNSVEDFGRLLVSGFGFSRPSDHSFTTSGPPRDTKWSLYCDPGYLNINRKKGYRKSYDIYSLGIILIEIAHWKPIDKILQSLHSGRDSALGEQGQDDRVRIIESGTVLRQVRKNMGKRYADATRACIQGVTAFGLQDGVDESNPYVAALLQQAFIQVVVEPLKGIVV
ncbi:hypothetical protein D6D08_08105 [Aureobasidium pullulans]|nr:hypothetical protein D6D08_08105 [Aureobasidium pullulans]